MLPSISNKSPSYKRTDIAWNGVPLHLFSCQAKAKLTLAQYLFPPWHVAWQTVSTPRLSQDVPILRFSVGTNYVVLRAYDDVTCLSTTLK